MKFRKKPVVIDAWLWTESLELLNLLVGEGLRWSGHESHAARPDECRNLRIVTLEGSMSVNPGDWIIKGIKGEFYPCKPDIFDATYDAAD